jgi:hypothetical protein
VCFTYEKIFYTTPLFRRGFFSVASLSPSVSGTFLRSFSAPAALLPESCCAVELS